MIYDTFAHDERELEGTPIALTLVYQSFCDPCNSTKPYVEALALEHCIPLIRINGDADWDAEHAGEHIPSLSVFRNGKLAGAPLAGAHTFARIEAYLKQHGVIPQ